MEHADRADRLHSQTRPEEDRPGGDRRDPFQRDKDRILYRAEFRRLGGIAQVVTADEPRVFHNRLSHSLKVGQLGRRLAEYLLDEQGDEDQNLERLDPLVVEAAGLAHDIGHPPFAHVGEKTLNKCIERTYEKRNGEDDPETGFEGNAQSFRILTKIAVREGDYLGLDLTRATLNAVLKYPWAFGEDPRGEGKWGYYETEEEYFEWVRDPLQEGNLQPGTGRTLEAEIMDWVDLVTYAIHDMTDFYRQGLLPLHNLLSEEHPDIERFAETCSEALGDDPELEVDPSEEEVRATLTRFADEHREEVRDLDRRYRGTQSQRRALSSFSSQLLTDLLSVPESVSIEDGHLRINEDAKIQAKVLAELTGYFVYGHPAMEETNLPLQQERQRGIIEGLWGCIYGEVFGKLKEDESSPLIPMQFRPLLNEIEVKDLDDPVRASMRITSDIISRFTDKQAATFYRQITGTAEEPLHGGQLL